MTRKIKLNMASLTSLTAALLWAASVLCAHAVENLQLTLRATNVVLRWPTMDGGGANYIVQYRSTLNATDAWQTLTAAYPAATGTNVTCFVHTNAVKHPVNNAASALAVTVKSTQPGQITGGGSLVPASQTLAAATVPLVRPADGSGSAVPLAIYPPGVDLTGFIITDPATGTTLAGTKVSAQSQQTSQTLSSGPVPGGGKLPAGNPGDMVSAPETGFYRVVQTGIHLYNITNGMVLSGTVPLKIEIGQLDTNQTITSVFLAEPGGEDGETLQDAMPGSVFPDWPLANGITPNGTWNTTQVTNGVYTLQLGAELDGDTLWQDTPVTVTVSNLMWVPDSWNVAGLGVYVGIQTAFTNGTWHLDIYDDYHRRVGYLDGSLDANGYCAYPGIPGPGFTLDNRDGQGNQNPSTAYDLVMTVKPAGVPAFANPPYPTLTNTVLIEPSWNFAPTYAVTCYMQIFNDIQEGANEVVAMMQDIWGWENIFHPNRLGTSQWPFVIQTSNDWANVTNWLGNRTTRDFIYFGHGAPNSLGRGNASITAAEVEKLLMNNTKDPLTATNRHPYRFVYLDGCDTANGNWPQVFGIPKVKHMKITDFTDKRGIRPRAFFGWSNPKIYSSAFSGGMLDPYFGQWRTVFWTAWTDRKPDGSAKNNLLQTKKAADGAVPTPQFGGTIYGAEDMIIDY